MKCDKFIVGQWLLCKNFLPPIPRIRGKIDIRSRLIQRTETRASRWGECKKIELVRFFRDRRVVLGKSTSDVKDAGYNSAITGAILGAIPGAIPGRPGMDRWWGLSERGANNHNISAVFFNMERIMSKSLSHDSNVISAERACRAIASFNDGRDIRLSMQSIAPFTSPGS